MNKTNDVETLIHETKETKLDFIYFFEHLLDAGYWVLGAG